MNKVIMIGRLTKDPEVRYASENVMAVARFTLALDRGKDKGADFPTVKCFGKTAELVEKYVQKGKQIAVEGRIQTGSYEKDGKKVYTTEVIADRIEFLGGADNTDQLKEATSQNLKPSADDVPSGFSSIDDDDIPF